MKTTLQKNWLLPALASMSVLGSTSTSQAAATISIIDNGTDVLFSGSGSFNTTSLSIPSGNTSGGTGVNARAGFLEIGTNNAPITAYSSVSGPSSFGSGNFRGFSSGTGDRFGLRLGHYSSIIVPTGYISGEMLSATAIASGRSLESLRIDEGTSMWTWGSGETADSLTIIAFVLPVVDYASLSAATFHFPLITQQHLTSVNGAHHRLLMDTPLDEDGWHTWATGDFSQFDKFDANQTIGEVGASRNFGIENFRLGLGVGHTSTDQDTMFGGGARVDGEFAVLEANYQLKDTNVILSALAYYGEYDLKTDRGYLAGGAQSKGDTDARNMAIRLRGDWKNAYTNGKFSVTPRLAYTYSEATADAYTETGGATPASFLKQESEQHEFRLGFDVDYTLSDKSSIRTIIEVVHREGDNDNLRGVAVGTIFNLPNQKVENTWGRLGFEYVHQLNEKAVLHASAFTSTEGYDATYTGSLGIKMAF